jgi:hypothetical protein
MVEIVTVADLRRQLRLDDDGDDAELAGLIVAARRAIENRTDQEVVADTPTLAEGDIPVARQAILMLATHWYVNRVPVSGQTISAMPMSVEWMISPLSKLGI